MSTLKRLRRAVEAGKLAVKIGFPNGYEHVLKIDGRYEWRYDTTELETFDTFEELYSSVEPDAEASTQEELNTWQIAPELFPEEDASAQAIIDAWKAGDEATTQALFRAEMRRDMEKMLFDGSIKNTRAKKDLVKLIVRISK